MFHGEKFTSKVKPPIRNLVEILMVFKFEYNIFNCVGDIILNTTSKVNNKRPENAGSRIFCNALDSIIYILNDPCLA